MGYRLDEIDRRILYDLMIDARGTSAPEMAETLDVSPGTIRNRIANLEDAGVITGFRATVDFARGEGFVRSVYICTAPVEQTRSLAERAETVSGVVHVQTLTGGTQNLHVTAVGTDVSDTERIARELSAIGLSIDDQSFVHEEQHIPFAPYGPTQSRETPGVPDLISLSGGSEIIELTAGTDAPIVGHTLAEAVTEELLDEDTLVISIERGDSFVTPRGGTEIEPYDVVTLLSRDDVEEQTISAFRSG
ncbi:Lrp/AsnC family transcriptional regulator [Halalkalirubrum salinum]|uniref:Lrp/AsnC family transcriptional regulator n=1 Tax=Halalkalirubrum salinum TaxID=2563889 RepID=UPI0010FB8288|nr:Lrp/AsnC family transcriptional regulator [Halalkalirubrum salinum]